MPGVHQRCIGLHPPRLAAFRGEDVELAVGTHQLAVAALHEDDPAPVGRYLGEGVAHAVPGGAGDRLRPAAFARIKGNPVEVVLNLNFVWVVSILGQLPALGIGVHGLRPGKDQVFTVRTPNRVRLNIARVVGSRQGLYLPRRPAVPDQYPACRIKHL